MCGGVRGEPLATPAGQDRARTYWISPRWTAINALAAAHASMSLTPAPASLANTWETRVSTTPSKGGQFFGR
jgi:hypothetical protein